MTLPPQDERRKAPEPAPVPLDRAIDQAREALLDCLGMLEALEGLRDGLESRPIRGPWEGRGSTLADNAAPHAIEPRCVAHGPRVALPCPVALEPPATR